jgi:hypothetical protein
MTVCITQETTRQILHETDNLGTVLALTGSSIDPVKDLQPHPELLGDSNGDSFWIAGNLVGSGKGGANDKRAFTVLFHLMLVNKPQRLALLAMSVVDAKEGKHYFIESLDTEYKRTFASSGCLNINMKNGKGQFLGYLSGDMDNLIVKGRGTFTESQVQFDIDLKMVARGPILYYLGMGIIPFPGGKNFEFALPTMDTSGTMSIGEVPYDICGMSWFDREWGDFSPAKWTWICIQPGNGIQIAIWDQQKYPDEEYPGLPKTFVSGHAFATVLNGNGDLHLVRATITEKVIGASGYPTMWTVTIGEKSGTFELEATPAGQAIKSDLVPRTEAKCTVRGVYAEQKVNENMFAFVEAGFIRLP